jgi:Fic family protein
VFSLYRSLSADETAKNDNEVDYEFNNAKVSGKENELRNAQDRIKTLENRIEELEQRLPKKYEAVKFLNYQNRKRILVSGVNVKIARSSLLNLLIGS